MALVVEPRIAHSLISLPVRGALQVEAMEPTSTQALRLMRSIHFQLAARATTTALSRTSARVSGYICRSWMAKLVIWASGNARPMQSPSTTGRSSIAAAMKGWMELPPPISSDITARNFRPRYSSIMVTASAIVFGSVRRSWPTSGAPMLETTATRSSSASSEASIELAHHALLGRAGACSAARGRGCRRRRCPGSRRRWPGSRSRPPVQVSSDRSHQNPVNSSSPMKRAMPRTSTRATPMAKADTAAAVGSKEYLR